MQKDAQTPLKEYQNTGFSTKPKTEGTRLMNADGSYNVKNKGLKYAEMNDFYNFLINAKWRVFFGFVMMHYFFWATIFAGLYLLVGIENLQGLMAENEIDMLWEAFFFSAQTLTTVGYEGIIPVGFLSQIVTMIESLIGILGLALITGVLYGRFSKPESGIIYSSKMLVSPYHEGKALMFKVANRKSNKVVDAKASLMIGILKNEQRKYFYLPLERERVDFLPLSWTIVHMIDDKSPIQGLSSEDIIKADVEFFINITFYDDTYATHLQSTKSYTSDEIILGAKFKLGYERSKDGSHTIHYLDKLSDYEMV